MKKLIIALSVIFALNSCYNVNESETTTPEKIIPKEKLINILTDIQIIEAGFTINKNRVFAGELKPKYYQAVLDSNGITLQQLRENINYYQSTPKLMEEIYESVLANLSKIQSEVIIEVKEMERINDSLAKITDSLRTDTIVSPELMDTISDYLIKK